MIVYQVVNQETGRFYIGKTVKTMERRRQEHYNDISIDRMTYFHKALTKYPEDTFLWIKLERVKSLKELNARERHWIWLLRECGHRLYNMTDGGDGGSLPGKRNHNYGRQLSRAHRQKISQSVQDYYRDKPGTMTGMSGELAPFYGCNHDEETKRRISKTKTGVSRPDMVGAKNPSAKRVYCETTGETFETATDAANRYRLDLSSIIKCCRGKQKTCGGKVFCYDN